MDEIKIGDVVFLKSGGPNMTVEKIQDNDIADCIWFDKDKNLQRNTFSLSILQKPKKVTEEERRRAISRMV